MSGESVRLETGAFQIFLSLREARSLSYPTAIANSQNRSIIRGEPRRAQVSSLIEMPDLI
jgi:hypothetical protein